MDVASQDRAEAPWQHKATPEALTGSSTTVLGLILARRLGSAAPHALHIPTAGAAPQEGFRDILDPVITSTHPRGQSCKTNGNLLFLHTSPVTPVEQRVGASGQKRSSLS